MKLTKAEILVVINDIDTIVVGINQCKVDIEADIAEVTKELNQLFDDLNQSQEELNQLHDVRQLTEESLLEAGTYRQQMVADFEAISKAEAEAEVDAADAAEKAKHAKYDVKLGDMFGCYSIAVTARSNTSGKHIVSAIDITTDKFMSRWNDPIEVTSIVNNDGGRPCLRFSSEELRGLGVVPVSSVHKSI